LQRVVFSVGTKKYNLFEIVIGRYLTTIFIVSITGLLGHQRGKLRRAGAKKPCFSAFAATLPTSGAKFGQIALFVCSMVRLQQKSRKIGTFRPVALAVKAG
jgi:hypothetical protein